MNTKELEALAQKYDVSVDTLSAYVASVERMREQGIRDIKYDFVEGTSAQDKLEGALSVMNAIKNGEYDTVFEGTVEDALDNLDSIVNKLS